MAFVKRLQKYEKSQIDLLSAPLSTFSRCLKQCMFSELSEFWSESSHASLSRLIYPYWDRRVLPISMHCRPSHIWYHRTALNRGPFRRCKLRKCKSIDSSCRHGCGTLECEEHVLMHSPYVDNERKAILDCCKTYGFSISIKNFLSREELQIQVEKLL